jgi:hypothetical protein
MKIAKGMFLGALVMSGLFAVAAPASAHFRHGDFRNDRRELRQDRLELLRDRRELYRDLRNGAGPAEIAHDRREIRQDLREIWQDRRDLRDDRWYHGNGWRWR